MEIKELGVVTGRAGLRVESLLETRSEVVVSELGLEALVETGMDVEVLVDTGMVAEIALQLSNLTPLSTAGAVYIYIYIYIYTYIYFPKPTQFSPEGSPLNNLYPKSFHIILLLYHVL